MCLGCVGESVYVPGMGWGECICAWDGLGSVYMCLGWVGECVYVPEMGWGECATNSHGLRDKGHAGMWLEDFVGHEYAKTAELTEAEVAALRLYTTSAFQKINAPLRDQERLKRGEQHPLPVSVMLISRAIRKLRFIDANSADAVESKVLWRGMRNVKPSDRFAERGGTEVRVYVCMYVYVCVCTHTYEACPHVHNNRHQNSSDIPTSIPTHTNSLSLTHTHSSPPCPQPQTSKQP